MNWLGSLAPRERLLIGVAAVLTALFVIWQFLISPVLTGAQTAQRQLDAAQRDHSIVSTGLPKMTPQSSNASQAVFDRNAVIEIARATNVTISRVLPAADGSVQVWLDDAPAVNINSFLVQLDSRYRVTTTKAQMTRRDGGSVAAQFTFAPR